MRKWRVIILVATVVDGEATQFFSWKIKDSPFGLSKSLHFFRRKGWWIGNSPWLGDSNENPYLSWTLFTFWLGVWKGALPFGLGKPWTAHECDLRQVLQDGISVGYLQLGLRLFHSNPKSSNKITVMDWMLHRTDALLIHVFYIYIYIFKVREPPPSGTSDLPLPRWVDVLKFLISTYRCDFRQCLSLRVQFVVSALQSSSAGFRLDRINLAVCQFFRCSNMFNTLLAVKAW